MLSHQQRSARQQGKETLAFAKSDEEFKKLTRA